MATHYDPPQYPAGEDLRSAFPAVYERTGPERLIVEPIAQPAAGANWSLNLVTGRECKLDLVTGLFATSAVVANRGPVLQIVHQDGTIIAQVGLAAAIAASSNIRFTWGLGFSPGTNTLNNQTNSLPDMWLPPGCKIQTITAGIDGGDQYSILAASYRIR